MSSVTKLRIMQSVALLVLLMVWMSSGQNACPPPTSSDLETVIANILTEGDSAAPPQITVLNFNVVCRAFARQRDLLRGVSVVVEYSCSGHSNCPLGTVVEQIESGCLGGEWSNSVGGTTEPSFIHSPLNGSTLSTTARDGCSFCFSPQLASEAGVPTDTVTHCIGECINSVHVIDIRSVYIYHLSYKFVEIPQIYTH